ncbi:MAG: hypothetical protein NC548_56050 [Lachnospiraceae bacterium]|nr:hypothetical protein [Lachnospiraceae bacterium]
MKHWKERILQLSALLVVLGALCGSARAYEESRSKENADRLEPVQNAQSIPDVEPAQAPESGNRRQWEKRIYVTADEAQGNILGYSLRRMPPNPENMYYEQDMPYLLEEGLAGKGIYVSDYMCETEAFLGNILKEVLDGRGAVGEENVSYFTEYALQQLKDTAWESLDAAWKTNPYVYDRTYCMTPLYGGNGYQFFYCFFPKPDQTRCEETNMVDIALYVNSDGRICGIRTDINTISAEEAIIEKWVNREGLFDAAYCELVIENGSSGKENMVWDFERHFKRFLAPDEVYEQHNTGLLESGNVCGSAKKLADLLLQIMKNWGDGIEKYAEWFGYEADFEKFASTDWTPLGENWIASEEYDCFFIDKISDSGYAGLRYYFYPDFDRMNADLANMAVIDCNVNIYNGKINESSVDIFPLTQEDYQKLKQNRAKNRTLVVDRGAALLGKAKVAIPVLDRQVEYQPIDEFDFASIPPVGQENRKIKGEIWGFTDAAEAGSYLGEKFLRDFQESHIETGEIYELAKDGDDMQAALYAIDRYLRDGWQADQRYDCFCVNANAVAECMHLQYYFYPKENAAEPTTGKTLVIDLFASEEGIESMDVNEITEKHDYKNISTYQIPLEEIAEKIEYEYTYENMIDHIADYDYKQLSFLPAGEEIPIAVYAVEGNKILFLPDEKTNTDAMINNEPCRLHYCEEADGFVFYILVDWQLSENGVPINALENDYYYRIRECIVRDKDAVYEEVSLVDSPVYFMYEFELDDMVKLGDTRVTFDPKQTIELQKIPVDDNEYIDAMAEYAADVLREKQKFGDFQICLETYGRVQGTYGEYTEGKISAAVVGEGYEDYLFCRISETEGEINKDGVWPVYHPSLADSPTYFTAQWYLEAEPEDFIPRIVGFQREVIELEVREEEKPEEETESSPVTAPEYNQQIDFRVMGAEETAEQIKYVYSYEEWFGMNELGCQTGGLRGLQDGPIVMYAWKNNGDSVFFVPVSKVNTYVKCENGETYPVYVNREGEMEFYCLERNGYAGRTGQLKTSFFMKDSFSVELANSLIKLGTTGLTLRELPAWDGAAAGIEEDGYIAALKGYIGDMLQENGQSGEYEMNIGEYEALNTNRVCLSAAVSGEKDSYYFRYMVVKSGKGNYYFWPAGFGLNSSLAECEAGRHYMNGLCIGRTKQLMRNRMLIEVD